MITNSTIPLLFQIGSIPSVVQSYIGGGNNWANFGNIKRTKQDIKDARKKFGLAIEVEKVIKSVALRQSKDSTLDEYQKIEELERELQLLGSTIEKSHLEFLSIQRQAFIDEENKRKEIEVENELNRQRLKAEEYAAMVNSLLSYISSDEYIANEKSELLAKVEEMFVTIGKGIEKQINDFERFNEENILQNMVDSSDSDRIFQDIYTMLREMTASIYSISEKMKESKDITIDVI